MTDLKLREPLLHLPDYTPTNVFELLNTKRAKINTYFIEIENKMAKMSKIHKELQSNSNGVFCVGIDALHFQIKLIGCDLTNHRNAFKLIDNHIYGEYYKLYNIILDYCSHKYGNSFIPDAAQNKFPLYKDLDTMKVYDYEVLKEMEKLVDSMIVKLIKGLNIVRDKNQKNNNISINGIHIECIVTEETYKIYETNERIITFIKYIETYITHHSKYLSDLTEKIELSNSMITRDVRISTPPETPTTSSICKSNSLFEMLI